MLRKALSLAIFALALQLAVSHFSLVATAVRSPGMLFSTANLVALITTLIAPALLLLFLVSLLGETTGLSGSTARRTLALAAAAGMVVQAGQALWITQRITIVRPEDAPFVVGAGRTELWMQAIVWAVVPAVAWAALLSIFWRERDPFAQPLTRKFAGVLCFLTVAAGARGSYYRVTRAGAGLQDGPGHPEATGWHVAVWPGVYTLAWLSLAFLLFVIWRVSSHRQREREPLAG